MTPDRTAPEGQSIMTRLRAARSDPMMLNSLAIMSSTVVTSLLGYAFWVFVARTSDTAVSGAAAATTSAIQATVLIASVGAATTLVEWLPRSADDAEWRRRVTAGVAVSAVTAAVGAVVAVVILGYLTKTITQLATPTGIILFCLACVFFAVGVVIDHVAVAEHRGAAMLSRNLLLSGLRIPILLLPLSLTPFDSILAAWTGAAGISVVWSLLTFGRRSSRTLWPVRGGVMGVVSEMRASFVGQHLITVTAMLGGYLLPVIVVARLSPTDNAYFYISWMLGSVFFIVSPAVSAALFVEGAAATSDIPALVRRCVLIIGGLLVLPILVYLVGGGLLLRLFGDDYAEHGRMLLILLTVSAIPDALTNIAVAVLRVTNRMREALALNAMMLVTCLVASWVWLPSLGIEAVGIFWLAAQTLGALWVVVSWKRIVRPTPIVDETAVPSTVVAAVEGLDR